MTMISAGSMANQYANTHLAGQRLLKGWACASKIHTSPRQRLLKRVGLQYGTISLSKKARPWALRKNGAKSRGLTKSQETHCQTAVTQGPSMPAGSDDDGS